MAIIGQCLGQKSKKGSINISDFLLMLFPFSGHLWIFMADFKKRTTDADDIESPMALYSSGNMKTSLDMLTAGRHLLMAILLLLLMN